MTSQLNDLKSQHIADEVKKADDKTKKNSTDILGFKNRMKQKEDTLNEVQRESSFFRGINYYNKLIYSLEQDQVVLIIQKAMVKSIIGYQQEYICYRICG